MEGLPELPEGVTKSTKRYPPTRKFLPPALGDEVEVKFTLGTASGQLPPLTEDTCKFTVGEHELWL